MAWGSALALAPTGDPSVAHALANSLEKSWSGFFGNMYPVYFRGVAYLAVGRSEEAAVEFQKMPDHSGLMFSDPAMAMARLQLGRALARAGDLPRARKSYEDLLKLWKNAESDLPILKQANIEYAKLR